METRYLVILILSVGILAFGCRTVEETPGHETRWGVPTPTSPDDPQPRQQEPVSPERAPSAPTESSY